MKKLAFSLFLITAAFSLSGQSRLNVSITSNAPDASVTIDNRITHKLPATVSLKKGPHTFVFVAPGYVTGVLKTSVTESNAENINLNLEKITGFTLTFSISDTPDANITVNNTAFTNGSRLPEGKYKVKITAPGFKTFQTSVDLKSNQTIPVTLEGKISTLTIKVSKAKGTKIFINDTEAKSVNKLKNGFYVIKVTAPDYIDYQTTVNLLGNKTLNVAMQKSTTADISESTQAAVDLSESTKKVNQIIASVKPTFPQHKAVSQRYKNKAYVIRLEQPEPPVGHFNIILQLAKVENGPDGDIHGTYDKKEKAWLFNISKKQSNNPELYYYFAVNYVNPENYTVWFRINEKDDPDLKKTKWFKTTFIDEPKPVEVVPVKSDEEILKQTLSHKYLDDQPANKAVSIQLEQNPVDKNGSAKLFWSNEKNGPFTSIEGSPNSSGYVFAMPASITNREAVYYYFSVTTVINGKSVTASIGESTDRYVIYFTK
ncbi:MAG TPA: PEGA domain-containing protein [Spirochaetota bacterium]|nr:PEGA domain-containing protein [Spirochaetota bacterium]HPY03467.1 PEGA domain-containing protein [Spirochaetota bacterium]HQA52833.1 PEGA domain-containing protein [Spirochaetota bacterium]